MRKQQGRCGGPALGTQRQGKAAVTETPRCQQQVWGDHKLRRNVTLESLTGKQVIRVKYKSQAL